MSGRFLVYYSVGGHVEYVDMFRLSLGSFFGFCDVDCDVLVMCSDRFRCALGDVDVKFLVCDDVGGVAGASCQKLKIFDVDVSGYDKVFYCDVDTLWVGPVSMVFDSISGVGISFSSEFGLMCDSVYHGKGFFSDDEVVDIRCRGVPALNFGTFGFCAGDVGVFKDIDGFVRSNIELMGVCLEQPFGNVVVYRSGCFNVGLDAVVSNGDASNPKCLMHFLGGPGDFRSKFEKIDAFKKSWVGRVDVDTVDENKL